MWLVLEGSLARPDDTRHLQRLLRFSVRGDVMAAS
jgi:hypothetical protein